ncbi:MAG: xylose isomerase, partial [Psychrobacillus psychrodurans]
MVYFQNVEKVKFEGATSKNPYAFKFYNPEEKIGGKTMEEILRYAVSYWHTFTMDGSDPFGAGSMNRPWDKFSGLDLAKARVEASFEFYEKMDVPFFCFHDIDIAPEGSNLKESNHNLDVIVSMIKDYMKNSKAKLLWNTA